jgi:hypothetical protein
MILEPFRFEKDEAWEAIRAQWRYQKRNRWSRVSSYLIVGVGFLLFALPRDQTAAWLAPVLLMATGLFLALHPIWRGYALADRWMAKQLEELPATYQIDEEMISRSTDEVSIQCKWTALARFVETRRLFLLYLTETQVSFIIPKRLFRSEAELNGARDIFRERIRRDKPIGFPVNQGTRAN